MPTTRYYQGFYPDVATALPDMVRFLINDSPATGSTGPGWTIVEAYDGTAGEREIPSTTTDLDSLSSAVSWPNGSTAANDWIVLETTGNSGSFQVYLEHQTAGSTAAIGFALFPKADFVTGGAATSPPTFPGSVVPTTQQNNRVIWASSPTGFITNITADEGMAAMLFDSVTYTGTEIHRSFIYIGEVDGAMSEDRWPFVMYTGNTELDMANAAATFDRIDPLTGTLVLDDGDASSFGMGSTHWFDLTNNNRLLGAIPFSPAGLTFQDTDYYHFAGWLRNIYIGPEVMSGSLLSGSLNSREYWFKNDGTSGSPGGTTLIVKWDGTTDPFPDWQ